ncbi:MAG: ABC transporter substrate-binding protein [Alphaproteobacteria bacterium]|nr:ABC transporter substrate-binding protein [Alphaproteobacteria bacterium]
MNRRDFALGLLVGVAAGPARSQQPATRLLAILHPAIPAARITEDRFWRGFFTNLRSLGYEEGKNLIVDRYSAEGHHERYASLAREIATSRPDVIVTVSTGVVRALLAATRTIFIVANMLEDPVKAGVVTSLAYPGNLTGVSRDAGAGIWGKRLQFMKEVIPSLSTVAFFGFREMWKGPAGRVLQDISGQLRISLVAMLLDEGTTVEIERVFATMARERPDAVLVTGEGDQYAHRQSIVELAEKTRLPVMYGTGDYVERGGLIGCVADDAEARDRLVDDVYKIFNGAKVGDLPIYQTTKFDLDINLKTAKALGLTIPPDLLAGANQVIE